MHMDVFRDKVAHATHIKITLMRVPERIRSQVPAKDSITKWEVLERLSIVPAWTPPPQWYPRY